MTKPHAETKTDKADVGDEGDKNDLVVAGSIASEDETAALGEAWVKLATQAKRGDGLPELSEGSVGPAVRILQGLLRAHNPNASEEVTGRFDINTGRALGDFCSANGLPATGVCDDEVWAKLTKL